MTSSENDPFFAFVLQAPNSLFFPA